MSRAAVSRPFSCPVIVSPSRPGSVPGSRALSSSAVWNPVAAMRGTLASGLPEADDVALGVGEVRGEAHLADRHLRRGHGPAGLLDLGQLVVDRVDVDDH